MLRVGPRISIMRLLAVALALGLSTPCASYSARSAFGARAGTRTASTGVTVPRAAAAAPVASRLAMVATGPTQTGLFTGSKPSDRHIEPDNLNGRTQFKVVYVVLESQYQSSMTAACKRINAQQEKVAVECSGYLLEELRDPKNYEDFKREIAEADVFIGSLIFVQELADKVVEAVTPHRDRLSACIIFPSMPDVMRLQKVGTFEMKNAGTSKGGLGDFMKKNKPSGATFEDGMLKLLRALPKVLKYLPNEKARDARSFMLSFQVRATPTRARRAARGGWRVAGGDEAGGIEGRALHAMRCAAMRSPGGRTAGSGIAGCGTLGGRLDRGRRVVRGRTGAGRVCRLCGFWSGGSACATPKAWRVPVSLGGSAASPPASSLPRLCRLDSVRLLCRALDTDRRHGASIGPDTPRTLCRAPTAAARAEASSQAQSRQPPHTMPRLRSVSLVRIRSQPLNPLWLTPLPHARASAHPSPAPLYPRSTGWAARPRTSRRCSSTWRASTCPPSPTTSCCPTL